MGVWGLADHNSGLGWWGREGFRFRSTTGPGTEEVPGSVPVPLPGWGSTTGPRTEKGSSVSSNSVSPKVRKELVSFAREKPRESGPSGRPRAWAADRHRHSGIPWRHEELASVWKKRAVLQQLVAERRRAKSIVPK